MTAGLEREKEDVSGGVKKIPDEVEVSQEIQKAGVESVPTKFPARVEIKKGEGVVISSEGDRAFTVQVPQESEEKLAQLSKGSKDESRTWWAAFWERVWRQARFLRKKVIRMPVDKSV